MNQALYAHMNNKRKMKKKSKPYTYDFYVFIEIWKKMRGVFHAPKIGNQTQS
jgi:hypothetical protein